MSSIKQTAWANIASCLACIRSRVKAGASSLAKKAVNDAEQAARGLRADQFKAEFLEPLVTDFRAQYAERIIDLASRELDPAKRAQAITSLSTAIRILDNIEGGIDAFIHDGKAAEKDLLKVETIERMSEPKRRLLGIGPY
jgi:hypothetical protein